MSDRVITRQKLMINQSKDSNKNVKNGDANPTLVNPLIGKTIHKKPISSPPAKH